MIDQLKLRTVDQDRDAGEVERMNPTLQERLAEMEGKVRVLTECVVRRRTEFSRIGNPTPVRFTIPHLGEKGEAYHTD